MEYRFLVLLLLQLSQAQCNDCPRVDVFSRFDLHVNPPAGLQAVKGPCPGSKAFAFSNAAEVDFPMRDLWGSQCQSFPNNYCIAVALQLKQAVKRTVYVFSATDPRRGVVWTGFSLSSSRINLEYTYTSSRGVPVVKKTSFKRNVAQLSNGNWHRIRVCINGGTAFLTIDCGEKMESSAHEPRDSNKILTGVGFIGRKTTKGSNSRQAVLQQGSLADLIVSNYSEDGRDASCDCEQPTPEPTSDGSVADLSVRVAVSTAGEARVCASATKGALWYDTSAAALKVCDGREWRCTGPCKCNLEYFELDQTISTVSARDVDIFRIEGQLYMCIAEHSAASEDKGPVSVHRHNGKAWAIHQLINANFAQTCRHFTLEGNHYLAIANLGPESSLPASSAIFYFNKENQQFTLANSLDKQKAYSMEFFCFNEQCFLAVGRKSDASPTTTDSRIYTISPSQSERLDIRLMQTLPTLSPYDWEYFMIAGKHYLAVANAFNGKTTHIKSVIYIYNESSKRFQIHQHVSTIAATGWKHFRLDGSDFLAVANAFSHSPTTKLSDDKHTVASVIYKFDGSQFVPFQSIVTFSGTSWSYFSICNRQYLAVANSYDKQHQINSNIYVHKGVEKFVLAHSIETQGATDLEHYVFDGRDYLVVTNSKGDTKVLVAKKTPCC